MVAIFESVPNISEGKDKVFLQELAETISAVKEVRLLDWSADADHNRSVFTFIGTADGVIEANLALAAKATQKLDIRQHQGVHPRLGVVDVMPIIPVLNANMADAVVVAKALGGKLWQNLAVPAIYYEYAADLAHPLNLAEVRRKGYNSTPHPSAGAICVGARDFLVAYNINLATDDLSIAKQIAVKMREKNSGLKGLKALGLKLNSKRIVQVSMNLTAPGQTPIEMVNDRVRELAKGANVMVVGEELIGLMPLKVIRAAEQLSDELDNKIDMLQQGKVQKTEVSKEIKDNGNS